jgi:GNAT superfamily N-acetyltransferase
MDDRRAKIGEDPEGVEMNAPVHEGAEQPHGQGPRIDARVSIRVATLCDGERLREMLSRLSSETIYQRFHLPYPEVPEWMLAIMLDVDHHDKESLVAVAEEKVVGHAMYVRLGDGGEAEMAIVVEDGWQSKGVGKLLLSGLAERARLRGVEVFTGEVLGQNRRMLELAAVFAGTEHAVEDGLCRVRMPLRTLEVTEPAARTLRRAA